MQTDAVAQRDRLTFQGQKAELASILGPRILILQFSIFDNQYLVAVGENSSKWYGWRTGFFLRATLNQFYVLMNLKVPKTRITLEDNNNPQYAHSVH